MSPARFNIIASGRRGVGTLGPVRSNYRTHLPQLSDQLFLTDAGMETYLIF